MVDPGFFQNFQKKFKKYEQIFIKMRLMFEYNEQISKFEQIFEKVNKQIENHEYKFETLNSYWEFLYGETLLNIYWTLWYTLKIYLNTQWTFYNVHWTIFK